MNVMFYQIHRPLKPWRGAWPAGASRRSGTRMTKLRDARKRCISAGWRSQWNVQRFREIRKIYRFMVTYGHLYHENGHETGYTLILEQIKSQTQDKPLEMLTASGSSAAPAEPHRFWLQRELAADGPMTTFCRCVRPKEKCGRSLSWRSVDVMSCKQQNHIGTQTRKKGRVSGKTRGFWQKAEVFQTSTKIRGYIYIYIYTYSMSFMTYIDI